MEATASALPVVLVVRAASYREAGPDLVLVDLAVLGDQAVRQAVEKDAKARAGRADASDLRRRAESLSPREHEVMDLVAGGLLNKQVGERLGIREKTVKVHRGNVMRKMRAGSVAELVRMVDRMCAAAPPCRKSAAAV